MDKPVRRSCFDGNGSAMNDVADNEEGQNSQQQQQQQQPQHPQQQEEEARQIPPPLPPPPPGNNRDHDAAAIVSGSDTNFHSFSSDSSSSSSSSSEDDHDMKRGQKRNSEKEYLDSEYDNDQNTHHNDNNNNNDDMLYCDNMDDEDEAWVYKHMRGGLEETITIRKTVSVPKRLSGQNQQRQQQKNEGDSTRDECSSDNRSVTTILEKARVLKPRHSDAILSCPCCFNIVCMDCQRHERYTNQYRAMFVMNIGVHWDKRLIYDEQMRQLKPLEGPTRQDMTMMPPSSSSSISRGGGGQGGGGGGGSDGRPNEIPRDEDEQGQEGENEEEEEEEEIYYSVYCNNCGTEVAALNMADEVYHFYGCVASGS